MSFAVFLLLFLVFFALVAVVIWVVKDSPEIEDSVMERPFETQQLPADESDETLKWLEEFARKQEESGPRRLH